MGCHSLARTLLLLGIALFGLGLAAPQESQDADQSKGALGDAALLPRNKHPALFAGEPYHEVMPLGRNYIVRDFTKGVIKLSRWWLLRRQLGRWIPLVAPPRDVGRYNECRADMYKRTVASGGESGGFSVLPLALSLSLSLSLALSLSLSRSLSRSLSLDLALSLSLSLSRSLGATSLVLLGR
ncbi:hypothetical protein T484DRAFT_2783866 [Baffinella frigidus]|nr:hypothetical protein T484DRAFT_2783866 [Cryptophyta sp. CCMP2293]